MIDVGFDLGSRWCWSLGQNLSFCMEMIGQPVVVSSLSRLLVLQPGDGAVLVHGGSRRVV